MKEAIERLIAELEKGINDSWKSWELTNDNWHKGVAHGKKEAVSLLYPILKAVLASEQIQSQESKD